MEEDFTNANTATADTAVFFPDQPMVRIAALRNVTESVHGLPSRDVNKQVKLA
ncbi:hypothetical protein Ptr86124_005847 [Pyrenophora tritici-repentis]|uniref:Uncharacterized protein n=1 Tax=Pyrenophora tritici-repentis TaxID=45151 RepID=A0A922SSI4_9PLEO|nr:hypothetical protein Ptr86124_005847 [Pyrenophora tritici-repentis]